GVVRRRGRRVVRQRAFLDRVGEVPVARDEGVGLTLVAARLVGVLAIHHDPVERVELGPLACRGLASLPVAAVPDPGAPERHAVALRRPREEGKRAALPFVVEALVLLAVGRIALAEVRGLCRRIAAEEVAVLLVEDEVRVEVVPEVLARRVLLRGVGHSRDPRRGADRAVLVDVHPLWALEEELVDVGTLAAVRPGLAGRLRLRGIGGERDGDEGQKRSRRRDRAEESPGHMRMYTCIRSGKEERTATTKQRQAARRSSC